MPFVVVEDHTKQDVHEEKDPEKDKNHKVKGVPGARVVRVKHHIGIVRRCNKDNQLPEGFTQTRKTCIPGHGSLEDEEPNG